MQKIKIVLDLFSAWWKRQRMLVKGVIFILIFILLVVIFGGKKENPTIETVVRQDLARTVSATGTVVSATDLALSFQKSDLVRSIRVSIGDKVKRGQILATLENASEAAEVQSARGTLLLAQAKYRKVEEGQSNEEVRSAEINVENARRKLYSDGLVTEPYSNNLDDQLPIITGVYDDPKPGQYIIGFGRSLNEIVWSGLESGFGAKSSLPVSLGTKGLKVQFPETGYSFNSEWVVKIPNTSSSSYAENYNAYKAALAELDIKKATARVVDVDAALAEVISAEGSLASAQAQFEKTIIRAPSDGTITKVDIKLGQLAENFVPVITLQDVGNLYIEANVNESNISHIALGQKVSATYDAFGKGVISESSIASVDIGATVVDGIVNYKIKSIVQDTTNIRSGMTANISIQTAFLTNVLVVPDRVVEQKDGKQTVRVITDEKRDISETREITTGLHGDGGLVEVTSGLSEGERIVFNSK